jgi:hypothetical protein
VLSAQCRQARQAGPDPTWAGQRGRIEVDADELRLRMADCKVDVPRLRSPGRPVRAPDRGTVGVHGKGGSWLANGSAGGLVETGAQIARRSSTDQHHQPGAPYAMAHIWGNARVYRESLTAS